jgi:hypothetical protein
MEDWKPDQAVNSAGEKCEEFCSAYYWMVPASVKGTWRVRQGTLRLEQKFQTFTGTFRTGGKTHKIEDGRVRGEAIAFTAGGVKYSGTVKGRKMSVTAEKKT